MAMNPHLQELVDNDKLSFEDVFELYAALCIQQVTDMVNDMIEDEGVDELIRNGMAVSTEGLTSQAVDWGNVVVPEMLADVTDGPKLVGEDWLQYIVRRKIEQRVAEVKAFKIKVV